MGGPVHVIESDDRYLIGDLHSRLPDLLHGADRHFIIETEHSRWALVLLSFEQLAHRPLAALDLEVSFDHERFMDRNARIRECIDIAPIALARGRLIQWRPDAGDSFVAPVQEMTNRLIRAAFVIG